MRFVIDSNVAVVANGRDTPVSKEDQLRAARFLHETMLTGVVLEDEEELAISEYRKYLNFSGQPSMGDEFFAWFVRERWFGRVVERISSPPQHSILDVLPSSLAAFDADDHKWICIFIHGCADYIVNAVDSDWANDEQLLAEEGIRVLELLR